jgi:hypothetical protein
MKQELELKLVEKYPKILKDYKGDPMQTCMSWGMDTGDGWYKLLDECMEKLQYFCDLCSKDGKEVKVIARQIKEKFGTLRFYLDVEGGNKIENDIVDDIINEAEAESERTCEVTGMPGAICQQGGWYKVLCYEESRKLKYKACSQDTEKYWEEKDNGKWND